MLGRLTELREQAGGDGESEKTPSDVGAAPYLDEDDLQYIDFVGEVGDFYKEILVDEGAAEQAMDEVRQRVENMQEIVQLEREALLPSKLAQLANRFESQELVCQRMIRRAKEMITALKADDQDYDEDDTALIALRPVRTSIARVRAVEFKGLVQGFFTARAMNRQEMVKRASRQLRYAYPDALEEELGDIMEFPELAMQAIARRLEQGTEVTLDGILGEMEGKKADSQKLEQGAKELKLMFLQFAELIDTQGENLNSIEANIKTVIEETSEAIGVLTDAEQEKRAYERKWMKWYIIIAIVVIGGLASMMGSRHRRRRTTRCYVNPFCWMGYSMHAILNKVCHSCYRSMYRRDPYGILRHSRRGGGGGYGRGGYDDDSSYGGGGYYGRGGYDDNSSYLEVSRTSPSRAGHQQLHSQNANQLAPENVGDKQKRTPLPGFIAPRKPLLDNEVIRTVAVMARGGAARQRSLRRPSGMEDAD